MLLKNKGGPGDNTIPKQKFAIEQITMIKNIYVKIQDS